MSLNALTTKSMNSKLLKGWDRTATKSAIASKIKRYEEGEPT